MDQPQPTSAVREFSRMSQQAYQAFAKTLPPPACPDTDLKAGFLLGIQFVLQKLREGFVIGE